MRAVATIVPAIGLLNKKQNGEAYAFVFLEQPVNAVNSAVLLTEDPAVSRVLSDAVSEAFVHCKSLADVLVSPLLTCFSYNSLVKPSGISSSAVLCTEVIFTALALLASVCTASLPLTTAQQFARASGRIWCMNWSSSLLQMLLLL